MGAAIIEIAIFPSGSRSEKDSSKILCRVVARGVMEPSPFDIETR